MEVLCVCGRVRTLNYRQIAIQFEKKLQWRLSFENWVGQVVDRWENKLPAPPKNKQTNKNTEERLRPRNLISTEFTQQVHKSFTRLDRFL